MPIVNYHSHDGSVKTIDVTAGDTIMQGAVYNGVEGIVGECGGALACATCHCYVDKDWIDRTGNPGSEEEREMLEMAAAPVTPNSRLGCQIEMTGALDGLIIHIPEKQY